MAIFNVESDKIFLQSIGGGGGEVAVYEIQSLDIALLQDEHWSDPSTIHLGKRQEFEVLKVGDIEIKGRDLRTFLDDLGDSRVMVNREGLCILPTSKIASEDFEVEYYRMFDLFDWSKYRVKSPLMTNWSRSDVLTGRTLILAATAHSSDHDHDKLEQKLKALEKELEDQKRKHESELKELDDNQKRKNESHLKELEDQKRKHESEKKELEDNQKRKHQNEVNDQKRKNKSENKEFEDQKMMSWKEQREKTYSSLVMNRRIPYQSVVVTQNHNLLDGRIGSPLYSKICRTTRIINAPLTKYAQSATQVLNIEAVVKDEFDIQNWWLITVDFSGRNYVFIYYDGDFGYSSIDKSTERLPIPIKNGSTTELEYYDMVVCNIEGLGYRYGQFIYNN